MKTGYFSLNVTLLPVYISLNLWNDLVILIKTIRVVLQKDGAY